MKYLPLLDWIQGVTIVISAIFAPWALGTVHPWSIGTMNWLGFIIGIVQLSKWAMIQRTKGHREKRALMAREPLLPSPSISQQAILLLAAGILLYIAIHAFNARAFFDAEHQRLHYNNQSISWLPHSYDANKTWPIFWQYFALFSFYFGTFAWLAGPSPEREPRRSQKNQRRNISPSSNRPQRLLLILVANAGLLALVSFLQRWSGSEKLLWLYSPEFPAPDRHFGPFGYRGNAATYFNLMWIAALQLVFLLERQKKGLKGLSSASLPYVAILCLVPLMTYSRAGCAITVLTGLISGIVSVCYAKAPRKNLIGFSAILGIVILFSWQIGISGLTDRLSHLMGKATTNAASIERLDIYKYAMEIGKNDLFWGVGPGAFSSVYAMHRGTRFSSSDNNSLVSWAAWAHSDPIETLLTFGLFGTFWLTLLLYLLLKTPKPSDPRTGAPFLTIGLIGFILHSFVDFPFQIYSLLHAFLLIAAIRASIEQQSYLPRK